MSAQDVEGGSMALGQEWRAGNGVPVNQEELLTVAPDPLVQYGPKGRREADSS